MKKETRVEIFNDSYIIRSDTNEDYTFRLASFLDVKMKEIAGGSGTLSNLQVSILAALNISNELFQLRETLEEQKEMIEKKATKLISLLNRRLDQPPVEEKIA